MSDKNEDENLKDFVVALLRQRVDWFESSGDFTGRAKAEALGRFAKDLEKSCPVEYENGTLRVTYKDQEFIVSKSECKTINGHLFNVTSPSGRSVAFISYNPEVLEEIAENVLHGYAIVDYIIIQAIKSLV